MTTVGIDLGTTNSVCCYIKDGKFKYLKFSGLDILPSALLYHDGIVNIGNNARKRSAIYPQNFIKSSKAYMGKFDKIWEIDNRKFTATEVATEILKYIREQAQKEFGTDEKIEAVITVPAYFELTEKEETLKAGEQAGLIVKQILTEPVSAAVAYGFEKKNNSNLFIVDIGGGTFDVSILKVMKNGQAFETIDYSGDRFLGGDNFDQLTLNLFINKIKLETNGEVDFSSFETSNLPADEYGSALQKLITNAEELKIELSEIDSHDLYIPNLFSYQGSAYHFEFELTREEFEQHTQILFNKIETIINNILDENPDYKNNIDKVILVGGSANLPYIQTLVEKIFNQKPLSDMDLAKLVAMGAALISDNNQLLSPKVSAEANLESTPEAIPTPSPKIEIKDIIPFSLGMEVKNNGFSKIIERGTAYPCSDWKIFTTTEDFQSKMNISVYEGEDETNVKHNKFYGGFTLKNLKSAPARQVSVTVVFDYDINGILKVSARDNDTGSADQIQISLDKSK